MITPVPPNVPRRAGLSRADAAIAALLLVAGALGGAGYYREVLRTGGQPWFYQVDFGPAVMSACGRGFVVPDDSGIPGLTDFLQSRTDRFDCAAVPPVLPLRALTGSQPWLAWSHLLRSASAIWAITGEVSWTGLAPLAGIFLGVTALLAFALFRLVARPSLSLAGTAAVLTSSLLLAELPHFRDYSKVPFMLAAAWLLARLLAPSLIPRQLMGIAALYGAALGVGIGFRDDPLITIPPFVLLVVVAQMATHANQWRWKAGALAVALLAFVLSASPVLRVYSSGGGAHMPHAALLGLMSPIDRALGVTNESLYEVGYGLTDTYAAALISSYATRQAGVPQPIMGHSPEYDAASSGYLVALAAALPADLLARGYGAMTRIVALPSSRAESAPPPNLSSPVWHRFYGIRARVTDRAGWLWPFVFVAAFALVSARSLRLAGLLGLLGAYLMAYPAIQFNDRHIPHLVVIPIAALLFVIESVWSRQWGGSWRQVGIFYVAAAVALLAPLAVSRWYQQRHLTDLVHAYLSAPMDALLVAPRPLPDGRVALEDLSSRAEGMAQAHPDSVISDFIVAEFGAGACDAARVSLTFRYDSSDVSGDLSHRVSVSLPHEAASPTRVMMATFAYSQSSASSAGGLRYRLRGLELHEAEMPCLTRVSRLRSPEAFPVLLNAVLPSDWERQRWYSTLGEWEGPAPAAHAAVYAGPADVYVPRDVATGPLTLVADGDIDTRAGTLALAAPGRLVVDGVLGIGGASPFAPLVRLKPKYLRKGERLVVAGLLERGGLTLGLVKDDEWAVQLQVVAAGRFVAVAEAPEDGDYTAVIANNLTGASLRNRFELSRMGWR